MSPATGPPPECLLVALKGEHAVAVVDARETSVMGRLATGVGPHQVAMNPVLGWAVSANNGTDEAAGFSLSVMDPGRMRVVKTIALGDFPRPHGLAFVGSSPRIVVTSQRESRSLVYDLRSGRVVREIPTLVEGAAFVVVGAGGSRAYVTSPESGYLAILDLDEGVLAARELLGQSLGQPALSPEGYELWIPDRDTDEVLVYDAVRRQLKGRIECSGGPVAVGFLPGRNLAAVACSRSSEVAFLHRAGWFEVSRVALGWAEEERLPGSGTPLTPVPFGLAVADSGNEIFVSCPNADMVTVLVLVGGRGGTQANEIPPGPDWIRCRELSLFPPAFAVYIKARLAVGEDPEGLAWYRPDAGTRRNAAK
ncbi:MAG: hypothetical protein Kow00109_14830 [Acidobacteriota bacterium]